MRGAACFAAAGLVPAAASVLAPCDDATARLAGTASTSQRVPEQQLPHSAASAVRGKDLRNDTAQRLAGAAIGSQHARPARSPSEEAVAAAAAKAEEEEDAASRGDSEALTSAKLLLAGGVAGAVSKSATAPLARLTILYQVCTAGPNRRLHSLRPGCGICPHVRVALQAVVKLLCLPFARDTSSFWHLFQCCFTQWAGNRLGASAIRGLCACSFCERKLIEQRLLKWLQSASTPCLLTPTPLEACVVPGVEPCWFSKLF